MAFKITPSDCFRVFILGLVFALTIPALKLLADFTRSVSQGPVDAVTHTFEIIGFVASSLTVLLLPVLILCPQIAPNAVVSLLVFEIPVLVILSGLWVGVVTFAILDSNLPSGLEYSLDSIYILAFIIAGIMLLYTGIVVWFSLLFQIRGTPYWTRTSRDLLDQKIPAWKHLSETAVADTIKFAQYISPWYDASPSISPVGGFLSVVLGYEVVLEFPWVAFEVSIQWRHQKEWDETTLDRENLAVWN